MMHIPIFVLAGVASGAMAGGRLLDPVPIARNFLAAVPECWAQAIDCFRVFVSSD